MKMPDRVKAIFVFFTFYILILRPKTNWVKIEESGACYKILVLCGMTDDVKLKLGIDDEVS